MKTKAAVLVALVGIVCGGYDDHYDTNTGYPHGGSTYPSNGYPRGGGSSYPYPGTGYPLPGHGNDLNLPPNCNYLNCFVPACYVERCRNFPYARCVGFCNGCVARFFIGRVNVTPFCGGSRPGKPNKTY